MKVALFERLATKSRFGSRFDSLSSRAKGTIPSSTAAGIIAQFSIALKGMSFAAECENPIMAALDGRRTSSQRAVALPYTRHASHASARVANSAAIALGNRADVSLMPNSLKLSAAPQ